MAQSESQKTSMKTKSWALAILLVASFVFPTGYALGEVEPLATPSASPPAVSVFGIRAGDDLAGVLENAVIRQGQRVESNQFLWGNPLQKASEPFAFPQDPMEPDPNQKDPRQYQSYLKHMSKSVLLAYTEMADPPELMDRPIVALSVSAMLDLDDKRWKVVGIDCVFKKEDENFIREVLDNQFGGLGHNRWSVSGVNILMEPVFQSPFVALGISAPAIEGTLRRKLDQWGIAQPAKTDPKPTAILE